MWNRVKWDQSTKLVGIGSFIKHMKCTIKINNCNIIIIISILIMASNMRTTDS